MSSGSTSETKKTAALRSADMQQDELEAVAAAMSETSGHMTTESDNADQVIPESETKKSTVTLRSADMQQYELEAATAAMSETIGHMMEDNCAEQVIPLPNVPGGVLAKVVDYCKKHAEMDVRVRAATAAETKRQLEEELQDWDNKFIDVGQHVLYGILMAAHYLCIKSLLDLGCQRAADMIKGKNPEEIRRTFHIQNDFTPEEEEHIRKENQWAFQ